MKQILTQLTGSRPVAVEMAGVIREYGSGAYKNLLLHVFSGESGHDKLVSVCRELSACCGTELVVGTMSAGEILNGRLMEQGILVSALLFCETDVRILRFDGVRGREAETGRTICRTLDDIPLLKGAELLLPGTEVDTMPLFLEIEKCRRDIRIFGGFAGGHALNAPEHFIFDAGGVMNNSMLVVTFAGESLHIDAAKSIGWEPLGMPFHVTRADGRHLVELDGRPAAEIYEKYLQIDRSKHNNAEDAFEFPMLAMSGGDARLRSISRIGEDGSMDLHGFVTEGMEMQLSYGDPTAIVEAVNRRLDALRRFRPEAILLYSCVVRKTFWESFVDMEMIPFAEIAPAGGFHTWGEILREAHTGELVEHNITLLSIGMREGDAPGGELPSVRIDDTVLRGQASLLKRLTRLVYTTMDELQKVHSSLSLLNQKLTVMAERDALTGLYNRGRIEDMINAALEQSAADGREVSLIMADLDHFKRVNDTFGHNAGDDVLRRVAEIMRSVTADRAGACVGRWGGEEFFILLPDTGEADAMATATRLKDAVAAYLFPDVHRLTVSLGVITVRGARDKRDVYTSVDDALYAAKVAGRNRVVQAPVPA